MVVCNFTVVVENRLNLCGVLTFEFVCVHVSCTSSCYGLKLGRMVYQSEVHIPPYFMKCFSS